VANQAELALDFSDLVLSSAFSADGQRLASVERDRGERKYWIRIRQLDGKQAVRQWLHPERVQWLQWKRHALVVGGQKTISIYDPDNGKLMHRYPIAQERQFALSGDGKLIAKVVGNYTIVIRDVASDTEVARTSHDAEVANLMFGPHNQSLITVDKVKRRIRVWWFMNDGAFATLRDNAPITMVRFSENEPLLYTQIREGVSTWQLPPPGELSAPHRQETIAESKHFGDYQIAIPVVTNSVEQPTTITIHAADNSLQPRTITIDAQALAAAVSRNGDRLAVTLAAKSTRAGYQRRLEVWNVRTNTRIAMRAFEPVLDAQMAAFLRFAGGDRYLVVGTRVGVAIVDARQLTPVASLYHPDVQNDGTLAATVGSSNIVRIWDINSRNEIARIESAQAVRALALSNDDQWLATLDEVGTVRLWALAPNVLIQQACHWLAGPCPH
jgi:WD40 repeat protein